MSEDNGREIIEKYVRVGVLLPLVFREPFDYRVPEGMELKAGDYVRVPFGRKSLWGVVWGKASGDVEEKKIKTIEAVATHLPPMSDTMRAFIDWVAWYTLAPKGMVLKMALPVPEALELPKAKKKKEVRCPLPVVRCPDHGSQITNHNFNLSPDQAKAAAILCAKLDAGFSVEVLDGVTGSGKTEVYFNAIAAALEKGQQALVLLPEIALSIQWLARFKERFGFTPVIWHSGIGKAARRDAWREAVQGNAQVVVGARSALFLPLPKLGLIVVDEEHDASYKQEDGVIYHARDMAVARARHEKIPALLVSATPSLETEYNIAQNRYSRLHLPARHGEAELPQIKLIDMRLEKLPAGRWISEPLKAALLDTLAQGNQAMLFMNRRGYAPLMLCRGCGHRFNCPHCSTYLVLHRARGRMVCHHCGYETAPPKTCPNCKQENTLIPYGPGVERIYEEARALLPDARIAVMTSDTTAIAKSQSRKVDSTTPRPDDVNAIINAMSAGEIDVLIGTQMIAKGHHFAGLALVGVMDADMGLMGGDLRAGERTYQLLHQLAGRAGREKVAGIAWLQTYMPEHPVMQALLAGDRDRFMALEADMRQQAAMPPYGKLAAVIIEGKNEREVKEFARTLVREAEGIGHWGLGIGEKKNALPNPQSPPPNPLILGPAPAPLTLLRGKYRYRILIKAVRNFALSDWLSDWLLARKIRASIRLKIDVEPYSFM